MLLAEGGRIKRGGGNARKRLAVLAALSGHERIERIEGPVESVGRIGAGRGRREVAARHHVIASGIGDRLHAALLHRLGELGRDELVGDRAAHGAGAQKLTAHEKRHGQKDDNHGHGGALGGIGR